MIPLRQHANKSITCLVQRLDGMIESINDDITEADNKVVPLINCRILKIKKMGQMSG